MRYAQYEPTTGDIIGFFDSEIHSLIPSDVVELTEVEYQDLLNNLKYRRIDVTTQQIEVISSPSDDLTIAQQQARHFVDKISELARLKYITTGAGQSLTYNRKAEEAHRYISDGYPTDTSNYPYIEVEMAVFNKTSVEAADGIIAKETLWEQKAVEIENIRLQGKQNINAAQTVDEIQSIIDNVILALETV